MAIFNSKLLVYQRVSNKWGCNFKNISHMLHVWYIYLHLGDF